MIATAERAPFQGRERMTLEEAKRLQNEFQGDRVVGECRATDKQEFIERGSTLNKALNSPLVHFHAFVSRHLWGNLTGSDRKGRLLNSIVFAHQLTLDGDIKLSWFQGYGFLLWHSAKQLAEENNIPVRTVYRLIKELEAEGWFKIILKQDTFGRKIYHFRLNFKFFLEKLAALICPHLLKMGKCIYSFWSNVSYINQKKKDKNIERERVEKDFSLFQKNISTQDEEETRDISVMKTNKESTSSLLSNINSPKTTNVPQVDEKINKDSTNKLVEKPKLKKDMHYPNGDRYFQTSSQQSEIRSRAKRDSVVGMSGLKDMDHLEECRDRLTEYYLEIYDFETAQKKVNFEIDNAVRNGRRSQLIKEFLKGEALGVAFKQEWEAKRGILLPAFTAYLQHQLRKDGDTPEQVRVKIYWFKKDSENLRSAWAECKRIINIQKPKLKQAVELGRDLNATDIPQWFIETFRPEIEISEIVETAEVLGAIAFNQAARTKQHQERLSGSPENVPELEESHPIRQLLGSKGVLGVEQPTDSLKREQADSVMDRVAEDSEKPEADNSCEFNEAYEINCLLADPITRDRGIFLAKKQDLPLLLNDEGVAIAVETEQKEHYEPGHAFYTPPKIEKGSLSAWEEAIAKSKFLKNRRKTMSE